MTADGCVACQPGSSSAACLTYNSEVWVSPNRLAQQQTHRLVSSANCAQFQTADMSYKQLAVPAAALRNISRPEACCQQSLNAQQSQQISVIVHKYSYRIFKLTQKLRREIWLHDQNRQTATSWRLSIFGTLQRPITGQTKSWDAPARPTAAPHKLHGSSFYRSLLQASFYCP